MLCLLVAMASVTIQAHTHLSASDKLAYTQALQAVKRARADLGLSNDLENLQLDGVQKSHFELPERKEALVKAAHVVVYTDHQRDEFEKAYFSATDPDDKAELKWKLKNRRAAVRRACRDYVALKKPEIYRTVQTQFNNSRNASDAIGSNKTFHDALDEQFPVLRICERGLPTPRSFDEEKNLENRILNATNATNTNQEADPNMELDMALQATLGERSVLDESIELDMAQQESLVERSELDESMDLL